MKLRSCQIKPSQFRPASSREESSSAKDDSRDTEEALCNSEGRDYSSGYDDVERIFRPNEGDAPDLGLKDDALHFDSLMQELTSPNGAQDDLFGAEISPLNDGGTSKSGPEKLKMQS